MRRRVAPARRVLLVIIPREVEEREKQAMEAAIEEWVAKEKAEFEQTKEVTPAARQKKVIKISWFLGGPMLIPRA